MNNHIQFRVEPPENFEQLEALYGALGWNSLNLSVDDLMRMCNQSWYAVYAFDHHKLIGMGRVISDGVITGIVCGLGVLPEYQSKGVGKKLLSRIIDHCEQHRIVPQLMCVESLESYYEELGFKKFAVGMARTRT
ncbi:GNAT family N-acetyltransferase [Paenibacillus sp. VCA1]|uniref:GNAT family N-acetyltransferase n=1 Tax=Paenibacillus sp. VCA1 TaxID=3039148 RepID=UPI00287195F0|nr:GNAT family N-acetyltransferase [Paenibacillus sp. VCA1]MDR9854342.1 GNAT family N-acetyltransferase [Paenibacillus sp. VCA1]